MAASKFALVFFDRQRHRILNEAAERMKEAMLKYLYDQESDSFLRAIYPDGTKDRTADSSLAFIFNYGPFEAADTVVVNTMSRLKDRLWVPAKTGGMARYENDGFFRVYREVAGNPWFVCTLWLAKWRIAAAASLAELKEGLNLIVWATQHASSSGVLSEQIHPLNGQPISVSPLMWSHAEFVLTIYQYLEKYRELADTEIE